MTLVKWNKKNDTASPRLFGNPFDAFFNDDFFNSNFNGTQPAVNIKENETSYGIELAAPGLKKEDFNIDLDHDVLTIKVEKSNEENKESEGYTKREFSYQSFSKSFTLPESVQGDAISGNYTDGILHLTLPKKEEAKALKKSIQLS